MSGNNSPTPNDAAHSTTLPIDENLRAGLALLWRAETYARDAGADLWDFALRIDWLYETGATISDLRWLVAKGFAENGLETSACGDPHRSFRQSEGLNFESTTCLVLTSSGSAFANRVQSAATPKSSRSIDAALIASDAIHAPPSDLPAAGETDELSAALKPHWDSTRRELTLADTIVKRFRVPARNQEIILCVFEEEGWPEHIDDPLPVSAGIDAPTRLHDAINRLNGKQTNRLLHFHGNGNGTGVSWELRQQAESHQKQKGTLISTSFTDFNRSRSAQISENQCSVSCGNSLDTRSTLHAQTASRTMTAGSNAVHCQGKVARD